MALTPEDIERLDQRAQEVGRAIGRGLRFMVAPNPEYVGVLDEETSIFILGPDSLDNLAAYDIELDLDALERGDRQIMLDEDGDPRVI